MRITSLLALAMMVCTAVPVPAAGHPEDERTPEERPVPVEEVRTDEGWGPPPPWYRDRDRTEPVQRELALEHFMRPDLDTPTRTDELFRYEGRDDCLDAHRYKPGDRDRVGKILNDRHAAARQVEQCLRESRSANIAYASRAAPASIPAVDSAYQAALSAAERDVEKTGAQKSFAGYKWGVGFGYSHGFDDIIDDAEIVNGVVRSKKDLTERPRLILEFHKYFWTCGDNMRAGERGCGPFVGVVADSDDILTGVAFGGMMGWRSNDDQADEGFSVGLGAILDADVRSLADEFELDEPPPDGETDVRFESKARWSLLVFFTRTF